MKAKFLSLLLLVCGLLSNANIQAQPLELIDIKINQLTLSVELADSPKERAKGLMGRKTAKPGMLFVYNSPQETAFWMANTLIPLDLAYIDEKGVIVSIIQMQAMDESTHPSPGEVIGALEMELGWYAKHQVKVGDKIEFVLADQ
ncbi:DUF192 domain-containing protein [Neptunicella sp. SCSIO 80796]|uniref:DUF192 domain-containing protein n=1 Tax=Neptunicella plasticusilytica TaxID=3117012 RepID=UPI003A4DF1EB